MDTLRLQLVAKQIATAASLLHGFKPAVGSATGNKSMQIVFV
jgi:hypothetical protein